VKGWQVYLAIIATLFASIVLAEDFKTITGKEYKDATVTRVEADGITLRSKTGISKVYFAELPKDVQEKFHYAQTTPIAVKREPNELEGKQDEPGQTHGGGKVVIVGQGSGHRSTEGSGRVLVLGQSAGTIKIFIAGIILLVVVALAIVRRRF
jgi:hypothetical protein